jgi:hypothetical protein
MSLNPDEIEKQTCECGHSILEHDLDEQGKPMACQHQYDPSDEARFTEADSSGHCRCIEFVERGNP